MSRRRLPPSETRHIIDVEDPWFRRGDKVKLTLRSERLSPLTFVFITRRRNVATGSEWVDIRRDGDPYRIRSVDPDLITPHGTGSKGTAKSGRSDRLQTRLASEP